VVSKEISRWEGGCVRGIKLVLLQQLSLNVLQSHALIDVEVFEYRSDGAPLVRRRRLPSVLLRKTVVTVEVAGAIDVDGSVDVGQLGRDDGQVHASLLRCSMGSEVHGCVSIVDWSSL
jgi:hypothetical protein